VCRQELNSSFGKLSAMLASGSVRPLQSLVYDFSAITTALRQFSHARHIGKIVVRVPSAAAVSNGDAARPAEAWAITGGLGALGTISAEWLAGQGAKHIHLLSRTGRWSGPPPGQPSTERL
jgi:hypothetical protein